MLQTWTQEQLAGRVRHTETMLATTLAAIEKTAEGSAAACTPGACRLAPHTIPSSR